MFGVRRSMLAVCIAAIVLLAAGESHGQREDKQAITALKQTGATLRVDDEGRV